MVRLSSIDSIGPKVAEAFNELMKLCKANMVDAEDLLVTFQNGFIFANHPTIGYGENLEDIQQLNLVTSHGIGPHTDDDKYFEKDKDIFLNGNTELETTTTDELRTAIAYLYYNGLVEEKLMDRTLQTNDNPIHILDNSLTTFGKKFDLYLLDSQV